jgi:hypothetical protein
MTNHIRITPNMLKEYRIAKAGVASLAREYQRELYNTVNRELPDELKKDGYELGLGGVNFVTFYKLDSYDKNGRSGEWTKSNDERLMTIQREVSDKVSKYTLELASVVTIINVVESQKDRFADKFKQLNAHAEMYETDSYTFEEHLDADDDAVPEDSYVTIGFLQDVYSDDYLEYYEAAVDDFCNIVDSMSEE